MAIPSNRTPVRVARGAAVKFTETIDGVAGAGAKALEDGEIVWDETNEKFQIKVGGSSSTTLKDHTVDTSGFATLTGANFTGDVNIADEEYIGLGGGSDYCIIGRTTSGTTDYSEIQNRAEDFFIQAAASKKIAFTKRENGVYADGAEKLAEFIPDGAVNLYYDNSKKFETTSSGVTVTGDLEVTGTANLGTVSSFTTTGHIAFEGSTADDFETGLDVVDPTADRTVTLPDATGTVALLQSDQTWTGAQRGDLGTLSSSSNSTAVDLSVANNFNLTLDENSTLAQPSNQVAGQSGSIFVTQDGTGSRTLSYHDDWKFAGGNTPILSTAEGAVDRIDYIVAAANKIHAVVSLDVKTGT